MSVYNTQSLSQLQKIAIKALDAKIPNSLRWVTANALAGLSYMLHGHIDYLADTCLPDKAKGEHLERWASIFGVKRASSVKLRIKVDVQSEKPAPELWVIGSDEFVLISQTDEGLILEAKSEIKELQKKTVEPFQASEGYGKTNFEIIQQGERVKTDDELRNIILRTIRNPTHGGNFLDYINWTESIPGVKRAFVKTADLCQEPGRVEVTFLEEGFKTGKITEVQKLLDRLAPAHADVKAVKPMIRELSIKYQLSPDRPDLRREINNEIMNFFIRESQPGGFRNERGELTPTQMSITRLNAVMSNMIGEQDHTLISPSKADLKVAENELLVPRFDDEN